MASPIAAADGLASRPFLAGELRTAATWRRRLSTDVGVMGQEGDERMRGEGR